MAKRTCTYPGCEADHKARGYCMRHYGLQKSRGLLQSLPVAAPIVLPGECWLPVVGWEGWYQVSDYGRVRRVEGRTAGCVLAQSPTVNGYQHVNLWRHSKSHPRAIHRLVLEAFVGPCPDGHECNHKDGDKANNCLGNLEWVTPGVNNQHALAHGLRVPNRGQKAGGAKLAPEQVVEIRAQCGVEPKHVTATRYGVSRSLIGMIQAGKRWAWLDSRTVPLPTIPTPPSPPEEVP